MLFVHFWEGFLFFNHSGWPGPLRFLPPALVPWCSVQEWLWLVLWFSDNPQLLQLKFIQDYIYKIFIGCVFTEIDFLHKYCPFLVGRNVFLSLSFTVHSRAYAFANPNVPTFYIYQILYLAKRVLTKMKYKYIYFMLIYTYYPHICIYIHVHRCKNT